MFKSKIFLTVLSFLHVNVAFAVDDPAQNIYLPIRQGKAWVALLRKTTHEASNTTTYRKETKAVVARSTWDNIRDELEIGGPARGVEPITLKLRDKPEVEGRANGTFSIYGQTGEFENLGGLSTKIKVRARIYINFAPDYQSIQRSQATREVGYLEIKVKNPTHLEPSGVNKYRLVLPDETILALFHSDPHSPEFDSVLASLKKTALAMKDKESLAENKTDKIDAMLTVIKGISQLRGNSSGESIGKGFIKPRFITSYVRTSYKYKEKSYPMPIGVKLNPITCFLKGCLRMELPLDYKLVASPEKTEYQFTVDDHVEAFTPDASLLDPTVKKIEVEKYYARDYKGVRVAYPSDSVTVEFKEPGAVASLRHTLRSPIHQFLDDHVTKAMHDGALPGYLFNHGKAGNLSQKIKEELLNRGELPEQDHLRQN
jgi:hypothetical protein